MDKYVSSRIVFSREQFSIDCSNNVTLFSKWMSPAVGSPIATTTTQLKCRGRESLLCQTKLLELGFANHRELFTKSPLKRGRERDDNVNSIVQSATQ